MVATLSDPYGIDVLLTDDGDLSVTPAGQLALLGGPMNCAQALVMRLRTYPGELPLRPEYGNALAAAVVGTKSNDPTLILSALNTELRRIFTEDRRFLRAQNLQVTVDPVDPERSYARVELVLAGGDRLTAGDLVDAPSIAVFEVAPELAENLTAEQLDDIAGADPDAGGDLLADLDEDLEGSDTGPTSFQSASGVGAF